MFAPTDGRSSLHPNLPQLPTRPSATATAVAKKETGNSVSGNSYHNNLPSNVSGTKNPAQGSKHHVSPTKNHGNNSNLPGPGLPTSVNRQDTSSSPEKKTAFSTGPASASQPVNKKGSNATPAAAAAAPPPPSSQGDSKSKGFNSWASLSKSSQSSQKAPVAKDTFAAFKKQAKDKEDKQKMLQIQQEQRRIQKEQEERERQRIERERQKDREAEEALDRVRRSQQSMSPMEDVVGSPSPSSQGSASPAQSMSERERLRKREQERRRREAQAGRIDMNRQSDIMANFEFENKFDNL